MKGLVEIPNIKMLLRAYSELQASEKTLSLHKIALWSQWSRFDPRLGELLVGWLFKHWKEISPQDLNQKILHEPWPAVLGVLLENVKIMFTKKNLLFNHWAACTMSGVSPALNEQFFIGLRKFAGTQMKEDALYSTQIFKKWGYLGREVLVNKAFAKKMPTLLSKKVRLEKLKNLLREKKRITVAEYRAFADFAISARQAERDLKSYPGLRPLNQTRARFYIKV